MNTLENGGYSNKAIVDDIWRGEIKDLRGMYLGLYLASDWEAQSSRLWDSAQAGTQPVLAGKGFGLQPRDAPWTGRGCVQLPLTFLKVTDDRPSFPNPRDLFYVFLKGSRVSVTRAYKSQSRGRASGRTDQNEKAQTRTGRAAGSHNPCLGQPKATGCLPMATIQGQVLGVAGLQPWERQHPQLLLKKEENPHQEMLRRTHLSESFSTDSVS